MRGCLGLLGWDPEKASGVSEMAGPRGRDRLLARATVGLHRNKGPKDARESRGTHGRSTDDSGSSQGTRDERGRCPSFSCLWWELGREGEGETRLGVAAASWVGAGFKGTTTTASIWCPAKTTRFSHPPRATPSAISWLCVCVYICTWDTPWPLPTACRMASWALGMYWQSKARRHVVVQCPPRSRGTWEVPLGEPTQSSLAAGAKRRLQKTAGLATRRAVHRDQTQTPQKAPQPISGQQPGPAIAVSRLGCSLSPTTQIEQRPAGKDANRRPHVPVPRCTRCLDKSQNPIH